MSYPFRDGLSGPEAAKRAISVIEKQVGADNLAAVIIEPIQGEGGFIVPADGFLPALVDWCRANDVVFIADEVQTGFARTGAMFASEHLRHRPRSDHDRQGDRRRPAARRGDRAGRRSWTPRTPADSAARTAAIRSPAPRRWPRSTRSSTTG